MRRTRSSHSQVTLLLAGWLFADLALGLVIVLMATATDHPLPIASPTPSPTPWQSPTPSPEPPRELGVEQAPVEFRVQSNPSGLLSGDSAAEAEVAEAIRDELASYETDGRLAAFVLTFGGSSSPGDGVALARAANEILREAVPDLMASAAVRDFWRSQGSDGITRGTLLFEIYLFVS